MSTGLKEFNGFLGGLLGHKTYIIHMYENREEALEITVGHLLDELRARDPDYDNPVAVSIQNSTVPHVALDTYRNNPELHTASEVRINQPMMIQTLIEQAMIDHDCNPLPNMMNERDRQRDIRGAIAWLESKLEQG